MLKEMTATEPVYDDDGWATRVQHYCPKNVDCPDMIKAVIGDTMFAVSDQHRWNEAIRPHHLQFFIRPSFLSGLSRTTGELCLEKHPLDVSDEHDSYPPKSPCQLGEMRSASSSENDLASAGSTTDPDTSDSSDTELEECIESFIEHLPPSEKSVHVVSGETRVSILTLGWFIERAIVHNLRNFYKEYPATVARFRKRLYQDYAGGDLSIPVGSVIDRMLDLEEKQKAEEAMEEQKQAMIDNSTVCDSCNTSESPTSVQRLSSDEEISNSSSKPPAAAAVQPESVMVDS